MIRGWWWLLLCLALGAWPVARAQSPSPPAPAQVVPSVPAKVVVVVRVIRASDGPSHMDPKLAPIASALRRTPFSQFHWVRDARLRIADQEGGTVDLGSGRRLDLKLDRHDASQAHLEARYVRPGGAPTVTNLRVHRDRAFFFSLRGERPSEALLVELDVRY